MRFPTMWYVRPAKAQISLHIRLCKSLEYSITVKLLNEQHLEFLNLKRGCRGSYESTLVIATLLEILCCRLIILAHRIKISEI